MGSGASSATPCLAGFFALRCFSLITIWVTPESWAVKLITSLPHWFYTRILRVPKCFPAVGPSLDANSLHNSGDIGPVPIEYFIAERKAIGVHDQRQHQLFAVGTMIPRIAPPHQGVVFRRSFHIGAGQVIEQHVELRLEQLPIALLQMLFDLGLQRQQAVETAI